MAKILLVDDEESIRITVGEFIREEGHEVSSAENVEEAFQLMKENNYDVIVTDIIMPKITGIELLKKIRETSTDIPIIMMTGEPEVNTASAAVRAGAFDYLAKPISSEAIKKVIRNAVTTKTVNDEKKRLEEENRKYKEQLEELVEERTRELGESEEKFRSISSSANDAIVMIDDAGKIIYWNKAAQKTFGYSKEEADGREVHRFIAPERYFKNSSRAFVEFVKSGKGAAIGKTLELVGIKRDGVEFPLELSISKINRKGVWNAVAIIRDITERKSMEKTREHYVKKLHVLHNRFKTLVANNPDGIFIVDRKGTIIYVNPSMESLLAKKTEELIGTQFEYSRPAGERMEIDILSGDGQSGTAEIRMVEIEWEGEDVNLVMLHDITDRKKAEDEIKSSLREKEILLQELYHRTKNNMQVICAMLELQSDDSSDEHLRVAFREMKDRIMSMALVHEKLYKSQDLSRINIEDYVNDLMKILLESYKVSSDVIAINVDINLLPISIDMAIPLGLILNELTSNSMKHAFPKGGKGEISIIMNKYESGFIELQYCDNGVGLPEAKNIKEIDSFGLQSLIMLVEYQLRGTIEFTNKNGFTCHIRFKNEFQQRRV